MKKRLIAIVAAIMSVFIGVTALSGCNIITVDNNRDMKQVVATVNIGNERAKTEEILKQDIVMMYLNYGSNLSQSMSQSEIVEYIVNQLINNRILIQSAMKSFEEDDSFIKNESKEKWDAERYLTLSDTMDGDQIKELSDVREAEYTTIRSINRLIDSYVENSEDKVSDALSEEVRTVPTDAANEEISAKEKSDYIAKGIDTGSNDKDRRKAYNNVLELLEENGLLGDDYDNDIRESIYYKELLTSSEESILIEKFRNGIMAEARKKVTYRMLSEKYLEMYNAQQNDYEFSDTAFSGALSSATPDKPVIYTPFGGYVYVQNLLLGASEEQTAAITAMKETTKNKTEIAEKRRSILQSTVAKDLRSTWILSGYDFDFATKKFTGDYAYLDDSVTFQGEVTQLKAKTDTESAEYRVDSVREIKLDDFISEFIDGYLYGNAGTVEPDGNPSVYKKVKVAVADKPADYEDKINELLFAFSTDPGSLNTTKGYVVAPKPDFDGSETYMQEFADAARELIELGGYSYIIAATDYGYHFMFLSEIVGADTNYATLNDFLGVADDESGAQLLESMLADWENADEDSYLYKFLELYAGAENAFTAETTKLYNKYTSDSSKVVKYKNAYSDLLNS